MSMKIFHLGLLYRFDHLFWDESDMVRNSCDMFQSIQYQCCAWPEQRACAGSDDGSVLELDGCCGHAAKFLPCMGGNCCAAVFGGELCLLQDEGDLVHFILIVSLFRESA